MKKFLMVLLSIAFVLNLTIVIGLIGDMVRHAGRFTPSQMN